MNPQIVQLESEISNAKESVEMAKALARLMANPDFKKVVLVGYLKHEAVRLVHLKQAPAMQTAASQENILRQIDSVGTFSGYLQTLQHAGSLGERAILSCEETLEEIRAEELNDE